MQNIYTYDDNGNQTQYLTQSWNNNEWKNTYKEDHYWSKFNVAASIKDNITDNILLYPNPVSNILHTKNIANGAQVLIFTTNGKLVKLSHITDNQLNISELKSGVYLIKIIDNQKTYTSQFIKY